MSSNQWLYKYSESPDAVRVAVLL